MIFKAEEDYRSCYENDTAPLHEMTARTMLDCATHCTSFTLCVGYKFNPVTKHCEFFEGCVTLINSTHQDKDMDVYTQFFSRDLALIEFLEMFIKEQNNNLKKKIFTKNLIS